MKHTKWQLLCSLATICGLIPLRAEAQVIEDGTTSTIVNQDGNDFTIEEGDRIGDNLFHSFDEFSVPTNGSALFNNATDIANIFSRVTGSNISDIDGSIKATATANLFLINPNGIIFGPNASINLGGSFFASTADSLLFEGNAEFSAVNPQAPPLLEVSIPIGARFRDNPGDILIEGDNTRQNFTSLEININQGQNLTLVGGNINFDGRDVFALGGRVELGGLSAAGVVGINENGSLTFPEGIDRADISLTTSRIFVDSDEGGSIDINARNLDLTEGSLFRAGINFDLGSPEAVAGDIRIHATDTIFLDDSGIVNNLESAAKGRAGDINITANSVSLRNGSSLSSDTKSGAQGNTGSIIINATESISLSGVGSDGLASGIFARILEGAEGTGGNVEISTETLSLMEGGQKFGTEIVADTEGKGNAGNITIEATNIIIDGINSGIRSRAKQSSEKGNAGNITIETDSLSLNNDAFLITNIDTDGKAGTMKIKATSVTVNGGSEIRSETTGKGNAGQIIINTESISFSGVGSDTFGSGIFARAGSGATGTGGNVKITTETLSLVEGGQIVTDSQGEGNAGNVTIKASNILLDGTASEIRSTAGLGKAGNITIMVDSLSLNNEANINASTEGKSDAGTVEIYAKRVAVSGGSEIRSETTGQGYGGKVIVNARDRVSLEGIGSDTFGSAIFSRSFLDAEGDAGNVEITTSSLSITNQASVNVTSSAEGNGGTVIIEADSIELNRGTIEAQTEVGEGGNIRLQIDDDLILRNNSLISARAFEAANGGNIDIDTDLIIAFTNQNNDIIANARQGRGGNINITAESLFGIEERPLNPLTNDINASSQFNIDGDIVINTPEVDPTSGLIELPQAVGDASDQISQNPCEQGIGSEFIITGKGGLPPNPNQILKSNRVRVDLIEPLPMGKLENEEAGGRVEENRLGASDISPENPTQEAVPAMGWVFNDKGEVTLTAYDPTHSRVRRSGQTPHNSCSALEPR